MAEPQPSGNGGGKGKKRKNWMHGGGGKRQHSSWRQLDVGMKGFLITCNNREREAVREAYNLLNEYADQLYGQEQEVTNNKEDAAVVSGEDSEEEDIEVALQKEVKSLKEKKATNRRFQVVQSGAKNCVFIQTTVEDPTGIAHSILSDLYETASSKSRYIMRMLPVIGTCRANEERISKVATELLEPFFKSGQRFSYCFNFKVRNNNSVSRSILLPVLGHVMEDLNPNTYVNMTDPDFIINIDILKTVCCFSCVRNFNKFRKYNLQEVVHAKKAVEKTTESTDASSKTEATDKENEKVTKKAVEKTTESTDASSKTEATDNENEKVNEFANKEKDEIVSESVQESDVTKSELTQESCNEKDIDPKD